RRRRLDALLIHADRVLTPSRFLADAAIANGVPADRVVVCPNGVDRLPRPDERWPGPVRFGYFGGPDHRSKGLPTLLAAADALDCGGFELRLWIDGAHGRRLRDRVGFTAVVPLTIADRVRVLAPFAPAELGTALRAVDCLVVPSLMRESYSLVTREALAAGVPVITSDCGGPQEIVRSGINGLVFTTGDAADLATQMRRLVLSPSLRARLAAGAAATPIPTLASQLDQLERVYDEVRDAAARDVPASDATASAAAVGAGTASAAAATLRETTT